MKIGIIGVGHMGSAILRGLKDNPENILIAQNPANPRVDKLANEIGFEYFQDLNDFKKQIPNIIILTTPADITLNVVKKLADLPEDTILISAAAGIKISELQHLSHHLSVVRIIPNLAVAINQGTIGMTCSENMETSSQKEALNFLSQLGDVIQVHENQLSITGTIAGCGPAFVDVFLDALADSGVLNGLSRETANQIATSMVKGSATLALQSSKTPSQLRDDVCSPGGTTIKGVTALEKNRFRYAVIDAINQANKN